jgi:DNA-binding NarL/FixJ family response regulator
VRRNHPETSTLILTAHDRDAFLAEMEEAGAAGFLTKDKDAPALAGNRRLHAIRRAARGEVLYTQEQLERARRWREEVGARWKRLTGREREVLRLVVEGETNREIAKTLCIAKKTVEKHVSNVLDKLEMESRTEAAVWAVKNELVE